MTTEKQKPIILNSKTNQKIEYLYHISDIHLERNLSRKEEYDQVINKFCQKVKDDNIENSLICITGDIIDFKNNTTINGMINLGNFLRTLAKLRPLIVICGNHDVNIKNPDGNDLIFSLCKFLQTKNTIYYLKKSGLYKYNNIIFSVASVFDRKLIKAKNIFRKSNREKLICLHHGFVRKPKDKTTNFMLMKPHFTSNDFIGYHLVLLGDIHKQMFIKKNIAYSSSLIQRNHGESIVNHGYILWDLKKNVGKFNEIKNDYGFITFLIENNDILVNSDNLPKNVRVKIKHKNTENSVIEKLITDLKKKYNVIDITKEHLFNDEVLEIELIGGERVHQINVDDKNTIEKLVKKYLIENLKYDIKTKKQTIDKIMEIHDDYYNKVNKNNKSFKYIKLLKLRFNNIFSYGENNEIDFVNPKKEIVGLIADNGYGKSSVIEAIVFALFDRTIRCQGNIKNDIMNIRKNNCKIELEFKIDNKIYKIVKKTTKIGHRFEREIKFFELVDGSFIKDKEKCNNSETIKDLLNSLGITYDDFLFSCISLQTNSREILDRKNNERKNIISKFLKLDFLNNIFKKVSNDIKENNLNICKLKKDINDLVKQKLIYDTIHNKYTKLKKNYNNVKKIIVDKEQVIKELYYQLCHIDKEKLEKNIDINDTISIIENKNLEYKNKILELKNQIKNLNTILIDIILNKTDIIEIKEIIKWDIIIDIKKNKNSIMKLLNLNNKTKPTKKISQKLLEIVKQNIDDIKNKNDNLNNLYEKLQEIKKKFNKNKIQLINLNNIKKAIDKNKTVILEIDKIKIKLDKLYDKIDNYKININEYKEQKLEYEMINKLLEKSRIELKKLESYNNILCVYYNIVGFDGIPLMVFKIVKESLEKNMNNILRRFSNLQVEIDVGNTLKKSFIEIYKLDLNNKKYNANNTSGFEKFAINTSFKIALSKISLMSVPKILLVDEAACIDSNNMSKMDKLFNFIRETFDYSLFITHDSALQDKFDRIIQIQKNNNGFSKLVD